MHILILSRKPNAYFNKKIEQLAKSSNIEVSIIDPLNCELKLQGPKSQVMINNKPVRQPDFVIPRMGIAVIDYGLYVLRHFELMNLPVLNSSMAINNLLKRYEYLQILASHPEIQTTKAILIRKASQIKDAIQSVDGPPAMLKLISSNNKLGALLIDKISTAESYLDVNSIMGGIGQVGQSIIIEEFIKESNGRTINVLVLNSEVIGCYYKVKAFSLKQSASLITKETEGFTVPDKEIEQMAVTAANQLNLDFALISFLESVDGPKIFEVNFNPQIEIFDKNPAFQIAAKVLAHVTSRLKENVASGID